MKKSRYRYLTSLTGSISAMLFAASANAATLTVNSAADSGGSCPGASCTLRQAIATAAPSDTINFDAAITTIDLTSGKLTIDKNLTISGPGPNLLAVQRSAAPGTLVFHIFNVVFGVNVTISGLAIRNGSTPSSTDGGAIFNGGTLTITDCTIADNVCYGGGFGGGAIYNNGGQPGATLIIIDSTISNNSTLGGLGGGGINDGGGQVTITNSTISGNSSGNTSGGGIYTLGVMTITNSTVSGNSAGNGTGGGIYTSGTLNITNSTVSGNSAGDGGGIYGSTANGLRPANTIIATNTASVGPDVSGRVNSLGYILIGNTSGATIIGITTGNQLDVDPLLGPLQDNGGPTKTQALLSDSPAINAGDPNFIPPPLYDQRGFGYARVYNGRIDIGSLEVQPNPALSPTPTATATATGTPTSTPSPTSTATQTPNPTPTPGATPTPAATITVTNTNNSGPGSLYDAITNLNGSAAGGTIVFDLPGSGPHIIDLTSPLPGLNHDIQIINDRPGDETVTVRRSTVTGTARFGIFGIGAGHTVLIAGLTISNGDSEFDGGGGISNGPSELTVRNCTISGNQGFSAGGISNSTVFSNNGTATLILINCIVSGNNGGAIQNQSDLGQIATTSLTNCILSGNTNSFTSGGGISNVGAVETATVTLTDCLVTNNTAGTDGGGIANGGTLVMNNCTVTGNMTTGSQGVGGAIHNEVAGNITVTNSTLSGNSAAYGGAIGLENGSITVALSNSTLSLNSAIYEGGALYNEDGGVVTVTNCTFSGNAISGGNGGCIFNEGNGHNFSRVDLINSTIAANIGGGILNSGAHGPDHTIVSLVNTILKTGQSDSNIVNNFGSIVNSLGHNLSNDSAGGDPGPGPGGLLNAAGDIRNTDPQLGPLADNGGQTRTHALMASSPAINAGDDGRAPNLDQRAYPRIGISDIGAFEFQETLPPSTLENISTRLRVLNGDNALIGGLIATGTEGKKVIIRAIGPTLSDFGVPGALMDPTLDLYQGSTLLFSNDDWRNSSQQAEIEASGFAPNKDAESAIIWTLMPGQGYTAIVRGKNNTTGVGLVEAFDLDPAAASKLGNISTRGFVDVDDNVMIAGLIVGPSNGPSIRILARALGPTLADFGVPGTLADPTLDLVNSSGTVIRSNNNWQDDPQQRAEIEATGLAPNHDEESALVETVAPGAYTAIVRGNNRTTGVGLVEAYNIP